VGPGRTRDDHLDLAAQLLAALSRGRRTAELAELVGASELSATDRQYLAFSDAFARGLLDQGRDELRSLDESLARAWDVVSLLPRRELTMLSAAQLDAHYRAPREAGP
jgi:V/A-type H+-transporting ATPase subunit B